MDLDDDLSGYGETTEEEKLRLLRQQVDTLAVIKDTLKGISLSTMVIAAIMIGYAFEAWWR